MTVKALRAQLVAAIHGHLQQQVERRRMRKLGLRAEAAVARIELRNDRPAILSTSAKSKLTAAAGKALVVLDGGHHAARGFQRLIAAFAPHLRHGEQHAANTGPAVAVVARKIGAAEVRPASGVRNAVSGHPPCPLIAETAA